MKPGSVKMIGTGRVGRVFTFLSVAAILGLGWLLAIADAEVPPASSVPPAVHRNPLPPDTKANIILITVDTLRADRLPMYGYARGDTPTLDALAEEGVRFAASTTPFPRTTPAMASLFTGLWPMHHGSREVWQAPNKGVMLTEVLAEQGWDTLGVTSNAACGARQHFDRGFRRFVKQSVLKRSDADVVTTKALRVLAKADPEKPIFLWAHYVDPHWPYYPPKKWEEWRPAAPKCIALRKRQKAGKVSGGQILGNLDGIAEAAWEDCNALYNSEVSFADSEIDRLIDGLKKAGRWENAIVVFTSDHGENMGEDGYWFGHGPSTHEAAMRVPLVIRAPEIPPGMVDRGVARLEDVMPTVLELAGVPREAWPEMDGQSMAWRFDETFPLPDHEIDMAFAEAGTPLRARAWTFLLSGRKGQRYCYNDVRWSLCLTRKGKETVETYHDRQKDPGLDHPVTDVPADIVARLQHAKKVWAPETARQRAAREVRFKLVEYPRIQGGYRRALYDLLEDPGQTIDVIGERPDDAERLGAALDRWLADLPVYEAVEDFDPEELEELRALGYIR